MDRRSFLAASIVATASSPATFAAAQNERQLNSGDAGALAKTFPPEWAPHDRIWMGWDDYQSRSPEHLKLRIEMVKALTRHLPVHFIVESDSSARDLSAKMQEHGVDVSPRSGRVAFHVQRTVDVWLRDCGPLFVSDGTSLELATFAWGNYGFPWPLSNPSSLARGQLDQELGARLGIPQRPSAVVAEGGGLEVNSRTLITYRDAMMHRNPALTLDEIELELKRLYGKEQVIWLDRAPITDRVLQGPKIANFFGWGANGHVDEYVRFVSEDTILVGEVGEEERNRDPLMRLDHEILTENRRQLEAVRDPDGNPFNVVPMPVPDVGPFLRSRTLQDEDFEARENGSDRRIMYRDFAVGDEVIDVPAVSYLNFLVTNGVVLSARYGGEGRPDHLSRTDEQAAAILKRFFPDREIVQIDAMAANWDGGGMHCLTQQQPCVTG